MTFIFISPVKIIGLNSANYIVHRWLIYTSYLVGFFGSSVLTLFLFFSCTISYNEQRCIWLISHIISWKLILKNLIFLPQLLYHEVFIQFYPFWHFVCGLNLANNINFFQIIFPSVSNSHAYHLLTHTSYVRMYARKYSVMRHHYHSTVIVVQKQELLLIHCPFIESFIVTAVNCQHHILYIVVTHYYAANEAQSWCTAALHSL